MPVNVKDAQFGAVGNGQTDDTVAIQNAVNYAKSLSAAGGGLTGQLFTSRQASTTSLRQ